MVNEHWNIRNNDLHRGLQVNVVTTEIQRFAQKHEGRPHHHENVEAIQLLDNMGIERRHCVQDCQTLCTITKTSTKEQNSNYKNLHSYK